MASPFESFIAGSVAGMCSISVCHPLDVLRTRVQISQSQQTLLHLINKITLEKGYLALYDGFLLPFCAQSIYKAVIFSANTISSTYLFNNRNDLASTYMSGLIAGIVNSSLVAPVEIIRTRQIILSSNSVNSVLRCVREIANESGIFGFWRTFAPTALRDGPGIGFYLLTFDFSKKLMGGYFNSTFDPPKSPSFITRLVSASAAGIAFWIWALPIDTVKTVIESGQYNHLLCKPVSFPSLLRNQLRITNFLIAETGIFHLYRAWPVALGRGVPSAAVTLVTYDYVVEYLITKR